MTSRSPASASPLPNNAETERQRFGAWAQELRAVHGRLRAALRIVHSSAAESGSDAGTAAARDLLLHCHGFCVALDGHHRAEDRSLFPAIEAARPELAPVITALQQDHSMIAHLLAGLRAAVDAEAAPDRIDGHLEGIAAIMENHFRYEERELLAVLDALGLDLDPATALGPF